MSGRRREGGREGVDARQEERGMEGGGRCQAGGERDGIQNRRRMLCQIPRVSTHFRWFEWPQCASFH